MTYVMKLFFRVVGMVINRIVKINSSVGTWSLARCALVINYGFVSEKLWGADRDLGRFDISEHL
jgi:hypothetical protein